MEKKGKKGKRTPGGRWRRAAWRLSDIFPSRNAFLAHVSSIPTLGKIRSKIYREGWRRPKGVGEMAGLLAYYFSLEERVSRAVDYATLRSQSEYGSGVEVERDLVLAYELDDRLATAFGFLQPLVASLLKERPLWFDSPQLAPYLTFFGEVERSLPPKAVREGARSREATKVEGKGRLPRRGKGMLIDDLHAEVASLRTRLQNESSQYGQIAESILSMDATIEPIKDGAGRHVRISSANIEEILQAPDRDFRKKAFAALADSQAKYAYGVASALIAKVRADGEEARGRGFSSTVQMALFENGLHRDFHDAAIRAGKKMLPALHKILKTRAKAMGLKSIAPWDRLASDLPTGKNIEEEKTFKSHRFTWAEGCAIILRSLAPMGEEYVSIARRALLEDGWFDRVKSPAKGNVAYAYHVGGVHPFVQMNWDGTVWSLFTATHELGHALHFYYASQKLPTRDVFMSDAVAEVSSCLHEILLLYSLFNEKEIPTWEAVHHGVITLEATFFRQLMWAQFEEKLAAEQMREGFLHPDDVMKICQDTVRAWMGPAWRKTRHDQYLWIQIPHLFDGHMVYQYATSFAAAALLADRLLFGSGKRGLENHTPIAQPSFRTGHSKKARAEILDLLSAGGSIPAGKLLSHHGLGGVAAMRAVSRLAGWLQVALLNWRRLGN